MANDSGARPPLQLVPPGAAEAPQKQRVELTNHERRLDVIDARFAPIRQHLSEQRSKADESLAEIKDEENREPRYSSPFFYWPFMAALAICEVPVNRFSFELFFRESPTIAMVVAGLIGVVLMGLAHGMGTVTRHFGYHTRKGIPWVSIVWLVVFVAMSFALIYGVAVFRQGYLTFIQQPDPSFAELLQTQQYGQAALNALQIQLGAEGWIFLAINLAIVVVGVSAAYFCHDPHPDFEKVDKERRRLVRALGRHDKARGKEEAKEKDRHARVMRRLGAVS
jgi:hypothetical protein